MLNEQQLTEAKQPISHTRVQQMSREQLFRFLRVIAQAIMQTLGSRCEVVIHDLADPEHSIVGIFGDLTGRKLGGSLDNLGLSILESGLPGENVLVYETYAPDGRRLKSTSAILRDADGCIFAALCINMDSDLIGQAAELLAELSHIPERHMQVEEHFTDEPTEVIKGIYLDELKKRGYEMNGKKIKRTQRIELIQALRERGVFNMRTAPTIVAELLGVSRFTIYNYINELRARQEEKT